MRPLRRARLLLALSLGACAGGTSPSGSSTGGTAVGTGGGATGTSTGSAGTSGSSGGSASSFPVPSSAQATAIAKVMGSLPAVADGGGVDLSGDGTPDLTVTHGTHGVLVEEMAGQSGGAALHRERSADGSVRASGDANGDGQADFDEVTTVQGTVVTSVRQFDDFDGSFDRRETRAWDHGQNTLSVPREARTALVDGGTSDWSLVEARSGPAIAYLGQGQAQVGSSDSKGEPGLGQDGPAPSDGPGLYVEPGAGYCDPSRDQSGAAHPGPNAIRGLTKDALTQLLECTNFYNPLLAMDLANVIGNNRIVLRCDGTDQHPYASDVGDPAASGQSFVLHLPPSQDMGSVEDLLHELLHIGGSPHQGLNDDSIPAENPHSDQVYAYARLCAVDHATPQDCAVCADDGHKQLCGTRDVVADDTSHFGGFPCARPNSSQGAEPLSVRSHTSYYCDGTAEPNATGTCATRPARQASTPAPSTARTPR